MGKSCLMAGFGKRYPSMTFCFGSELHGYPPQDFDARRSILEPILINTFCLQCRAGRTIERDRELSLIWTHALAAAYLQASFDYC